MDARAWRAHVKFFKRKEKVLTVLEFLTLRARIRVKW